jgi:hypothetical protein
MDYFINVSFSIKSSFIWFVNRHELQKVVENKLTMYVLFCIESTNLEVTPVIQAESEDSEDNLDDDEAEDDGENDDDEEEEDEEEPEKSLMFEKRVTLQVQDGLTAVWSTKGLGDLQILYDPDIFGARICVEQDGTGEQLCNTIIALNTVLEVRNIKL